MIKLMLLIFYLCERGSLHLAPVMKGLELRVSSLPEGSGDADIDPRYALEPALNFAVGLGADGGCAGDWPCIGDYRGC